MPVGIRPRFAFESQPLRDRDHRAFQPLRGGAVGVQVPGEFDHEVDAFGIAGARGIGRAASSTRRTTWTLFLAWTKHRTTLAAFTGRAGAGSWVSVNGRIIAKSPVMDYNGGSPNETASMATAAARAVPDLATASAAAKALRTFFRIADAWGLTNEQQRQLLDCGRSTFYEWKSGRGEARAGQRDARTHVARVRHLRGAAVAAAHPGARHAWIKRANAAPLFGGGTALDRMLQARCSDLFVVRQYLDAQRGGWRERGG